MHKEHKKPPQFGAASYIVRDYRSIFLATIVVKYAAVKTPRNPSSIVIELLSGLNAEILPYDEVINADAL